MKISDNKELGYLVMVIRNMEKEDWKEVLEIYRQGIESGIATFQEKLPTWEEWDRKHIDRCRLVSISDGFITGWAALSSTSSMEAYNGVAEVSIYINKNYRGLGVGTLLLNKIIKESENNGFWTLQSLIISKNTSSLELHKKCGFRVLGVREKIAKMKNIEWMDVVIMERRSRLITFS